MLEGYGLYHLTATHIGRNAVEPLFLAIEYTDACRAIYFVTAESIEVAIEVLDIHLKMRGTLGSVD